MTKFKSKKIIQIIIIMVLLLLCAYPTFLVYETNTYKKYAGEELYWKNSDEIILIYKNNIIDMSSYDNSSLITRLQYKQRKLCFDNIEDSKKHITVSVPNKITIKISPKDNNSVFLDFDMEKGLNRNYILQDINFEEFLRIFYEITKNNLFSATA